MISPSNLIPEPLAGWASRLGLFAAALVAVALVLHRFAMLSTPVAINITLAAFAIASFGLLVGVLAVISIWVRGRTGAWSAATGVLIAAVMWIWPAAFASSFMTLPAINDVTTDTASPPAFGMLARVRGPGANKGDYPGDAFAREQARGYPDLRTLVVERSVDEVFDLAVLTVRGRRGLGWKVLVEEPPSSRPPRAGVIEATERTLILGFIDDVSIRVTGNDMQARVDVRSASRFGRHDLGTNASRIRRFIRELQARLEATAPAAIAARGGTRAARAAAGAPDAGLKRPKDRLPEKAAGKSAKESARPDAQRAPGSKAQPRG